MKYHKCVKYDRVSGKVVKHRKLSEHQLATRDLSKKYVWLEEVQGVTDSYDPETQKIIKTYELPDLSDLSISVDVGVKMAINYIAINLTADEIQANKEKKIYDTDQGLIRGIEDIIVMISKGAPLNKNSLPVELIDKVNVRRRYRGEADI